MAGPSTTERIKRAKHYRERANQLRATAREWRNGEPRATLLRLAESYDRMAAEIEQSVRRANRRG